MKHSDRVTRLMRTEWVKHRMGSIANPVRCPVGSYSESVAQCIGRPHQSLPAMMCSAPVLTRLRLCAQAAANSKMRSTGDTSAGISRNASAAAQQSGGLAVVSKLSHTDRTSPRIASAPKSRTPRKAPPVHWPVVKVDSSPAARDSSPLNKR